MTFGVIGALDEEVRLIREQMRVHREVRAYGTTYYCGEYAGHGLVVVCSSIGTINAAVCASTLIRELGADAVVNVGIAGSLCPDLHILDVVISDKVAFHDADTDVLGRYYPNRRDFQADTQLRQLCVRAIESMADRAFSYKVGLVASGDWFVSDRQRKEQILSRLHPLCVEMEGAAIGQVAFMNDKPFLVIRTLSDNADDEADNTYDNFMERAAHNSARLVLRMLEEYRA